MHVEREALLGLGKSGYQALFADRHLARIDMGSPAQIVYRHEEQIEPAEAERSAREMVESYGLEAVASQSLAA